MMQVMTLARSLYDCPKPWQNLIDSLELADLNLDYDNSLKLINETLSVYDAVFSEIGTDGAVEFYTDPGHTMFILRFT